MKHSIKSVLILLISTFSLFLFSDSAEVVFESEPGGGVIVAIKKNDAVAMESEKVIIFPVDYIKYDMKNPVYPVPPVFTVKCIFNFFNTAGEKQDVLMGFPEYSHKGELVYRDTVLEEFFEEDLVSGFTVIVDNKTEKAERVAGDHYDYFWTFPVSFNGHEKKSVINTYNQRLCEHRFFMTNYFMLYILDTGACWKGVIKSCEIIQYTFSDVDYFIKNNLEPDKNDNIMLTVNTLYHIPHTISSSSLHPEPARGFYYNPFCARDGNPDTAWVEGSPDYGIREWLGIKMPLVNGTAKNKIKGIRLMNGYQSSERLFKRNSRVKKARILFFTESSALGYLSDEYDSKEDFLEKLHSITAVIQKELKDIESGKSGKITFRDVDIADTFGWQEIQFSKSINCSFLVMQILDVYKGTQYKDTCIAEIEAIW